MRHRTITLQSPSPGTQRHLNCFEFGPEVAHSPAVYLQAALHADEWPGLLVLQHLMQQLQDLDAQGRVLKSIRVVPYANPIGMSQNVFGYVTGRFDLVGTGNFNRNFPDFSEAVVEAVTPALADDPEANRTAVMKAIRESLDGWYPEDESACLKKCLMELSVGARVILDLHCDDRTNAHLYASKSQLEEAIMLAKTLHIDTVLLEDTVGPVAFDGTHLRVWQTVQDRFPHAGLADACFAATVEYRGQIDVADGLAQQDALNLLDYLTHLGVVDGTLRGEGLPRDQVHCLPLEAVDVLKAPVAGLVMFSVELLESVKEGQKVAEILLIDADKPNQRIPVHARTDGYMMGLSHRRLVRPGDQIGKVAGTRPLPHRRPGELLQL